MGEALRQARLAYDAGEVPVGAVIVRDGKIIARAFNQVELLKDATAHAEILAITQAANALGDWRLEGARLFVTKEPCPMCAGAIVLSRIKRLVFGVHDERAGGAGSVFAITSAKGLNHTVEVVAGSRKLKPATCCRISFADAARKSNSGPWPSATAAETCASVGLR